VECGDVPNRKQMRPSALIAGKVDKVNGHWGTTLLLMLIRLLVLDSPASRIDKVVGVVVLFGC
jgi:hypothetical protein